MLCFMLIVFFVLLGMFCLLFVLFVYMMLYLVFCRSFWCWFNIRLFDVFYVIGCVMYVVMFFVWFMYNDIKCVFVEVVDKVKGKLWFILILCSGCCRIKLEFIIVEWNLK